MQTFTFYNPTKIYFGKNSIDKLAGELPGMGTTILVVYGGGSIRKNGIYDRVMQDLDNAGKKVYELGGVMPNPRTEKVAEGIQICREKKVDFILALGGGSVIDCAKIIAAGTHLEEDFWDALLIKHKPITKAVPLGTVLTIAATGSEMNCGAVITNWTAQLKESYEHPLLYPRFSILDPVYTYSLPKEQLIYGGVDMLSHLFEAYFSLPDYTNVSDSLAEALMRSVVENLTVAIGNPTDEHARANLMWAGTMALNNITFLGKGQDWQAHRIEHALSAFYDIPHGAGLAIVHPNLMKYVYKKAIPKFARYATQVWGIDPAGKTEEELAVEGIQATQAYFKKIGAPTTLREVNIPASAIDKIAATIPSTSGGYMRMTEQDIRNILLSCV